jgi:hypothetical protein
MDSLIWLMTETIGLWIPEVTENLEEGGPLLSEGLASGGHCLLHEDVGP